MAFCPKCGTQIPDNGICANCGSAASAPLPPPGYGTPPSSPDYGTPPPPAGGPDAVVRNVVTCIILAIVTCGIYYLYWLWVTHKQINELAGTEIVGSGMLILGWFCTPVLWYDWYKWDNALQDIAARYHIRYSSNFILWIILTFFGFGPFVMMFQVQEALNQAYGA